jgi:hypothetical protein
MNKTYSVHGPLKKPLRVWVRTDVLYNFETKNQEWVKGEIFGITCIKGFVPVFDILLDGGYIFSDIPPHLVRTKKPEENSFPKMELNDLVYSNCSSKYFSLTSFPFLSDKNLFYHFSEKNLYLKASYIMTVDFYKGNDWLHMLELETGNLAFMPNHKIVFSKNISENHKFPAFKELKKTFSVSK